jgi:tetratricopeptide (TPR) repeat protein
VGDESAPHTDTLGFQLLTTTPVDDRVVLQISSGGGGALVSIDKLERLVNEQRYLAARELFREQVGADAFAEGSYPLACHLAAVAEARLGNLRRAITLSQDADTLAAEYEDWNLVARVGQNLIDLYRTAGEYGQAADRGHRWLKEMHRYPGMLQRRGRVEYNLALVYREKGDSAAARPLLLAAVEHMAEDVEQPVFRVMALQMLARLAYEAEDFETGDQAWQEAEDLVQPSDLEGRREQLLLRAFRAFFALDYDQALILVEEFVVPNSPTTVLQKMGAVWIAGMTAAKQGYLQLAREMAERLQQLAMDRDKIISTHYINGATEILRRVDLYESMSGETGETGET